MIETGPLIFLESFITPGNIVDRDGHLPPDPYTCVSNIENIAVLLPDSNEEFKILLMIPDIKAIEPSWDSTLHSDMEAILFFRAFINVRVTKDEIQELKEALDQE